MALIFDSCCRIYIYMVLVRWRRTLIACSPSLGLLSLASVYGTIELGITPSLGWKGNHIMYFWDDTYIWKRTPCVIFCKTAFLRYKCSPLNALHPRMHRSVERTYGVRTRGNVIYVHFGNIIASFLAVPHVCQQHLMQYYEAKGA